MVAGADGPRRHVASLPLTSTVFASPGASVSCLFCPVHCFKEPQCYPLAAGHLRLGSPEIPANVTCPQSTPELWLGAPSPRHPPPTSCGAWHHTRRVSGPASVTLNAVCVRSCLEFHRKHPSASPVALPAPDPCLRHASALRFTPMQSLTSATASALLWN